MKVRPMKVRHIERHELVEFCRLGRNSEEAVVCEAKLRAMWESGKACPESCFVVEENDEFIAGALFRRTGAGTQESDTRIIDGRWWHLPQDDSFLQVGTTLVHRGVAVLPGHVTDVTGKVSSGTDDADRIREILIASGLVPYQTRISYVWDEPREQVTVPSRLEYSSLDETGDDQFIGVIERVIEGSLNQWDIKAMSSGRSHHEIALEHFQIESDYFGFESSWWQIARDKDGEVVGFVEPVVFKDLDKGGLKKGTVNYIGVVPERRGRGYSLDLLLEATQILQDVGTWRIFCDTDAENTPMQRTFDQAGYETSQTEWVYTLHL